MGEAIQGVGRARACLGDLGYGPVPVTGRNVCTRAFVTSVSVSENVQKKIGESTYPIGNNRSM